MNQLPIKQQVQQLRLQGKSIRAIARELGASRYRVGKMLHGLELHRQNARVQALEEKLASHELTLRLLLGYVPRLVPVPTKEEAYSVKTDLVRRVYLHSIEESMRARRQQLERVVQRALQMREKAVATRASDLQRQLLQRGIRL